MTTENKGFDSQIIEKYRQKIKAAGTPYIIEDSTDNSEEFVNFYFIGTYDEREVIYDAVIYTLRLHHESELYEIAEHRAAQHFPTFKSIRYKEDENGDLMALDDVEEEIGLYITEVMTELEEEGEVKVQEHVEIDPNIDFGIGLNAGLNVEEVTPKVIKKFIKEFNEDKLKLDDTFYSFQVMDT